MIILVTGLVVLFIGLYLAINQNYMAYLKEYEFEQWARIRGSKQGFMVFMDHIALLNWLLRGDYEQCSNKETHVLGGLAHKRAYWAKHLIMTGVILIFLGFLLSLVFLV
ncbi:hypothetical protein [Agaribacterium sp. ZY112]|uniref:hypothetical protein n=1 Tax=Agaribacterium sp. ZY112 TaxID=3233574 RepID=UPI0035255FAA